MTTKKKIWSKNFLTPKMAKNGQIWAKIDNLSIFGPYFPNAAMRYSFRKSRCMVWENSEMAKIWPFVAKIWPFLAKIDRFGGFWP